MSLMGTLCAQGPWARQSVPYNNGGTLTPRDIAADPFGNTYLMGDFGGQVQVGDFQLEDFNKVSDIGPLVLLKYSPQGNVIWAKPFSAKGSSRGYGVATDPQGRAYICGSYDQTNSFTLLDLGNGVQLEGNPSESVFVAMLDSAGNTQWASRILATDEPGTQYIRPKDIVADAGGNVYITGKMLAPVNANGQVFNQNNPGKDQAFVAKFDASGSLLWFRQTETVNQNGFAGGENLVLTSNGGVVVSGTYEQSVRWGADTLPLIANGGINLFIVSFGPDGALNWWQMAASGGSGNQQPHELGIDQQGNIYTTLRAAGQISLKDSSFFFEIDRYLLKFNANGQRVFVRPLYKKSTSFSAGIDVHSLYTRPDGQTFLTGTYGFQPPVFGSDTLPIDPAGFNPRNYLAVYDANGHMLGGSSLFEEHLSQFYEIKSNTLIQRPDGHLQLTGTFEGQVVFLGDSLDSQGGQDQGFLLSFRPEALFDA
ncbi:MAG: hypothetical protein D6730_16345, partial [Bacteroidetes bacterium]